MIFNSNIELGSFVLSKSIYGVDKYVGKTGKISDKVILDTGECIDRYVYGKCLVYSCKSLEPEQCIDIVMNGHGIKGLSIGKLLGELITVDLISYSRTIKFPIEKTTLERSLREEIDKLVLVWSYKILEYIGLNSNSYCYY